MTTYRRLAGMFVFVSLLHGVTPLWAQGHRYEWQQEYRGNPQGLLYRIYFLDQGIGIGAAHLGSVTCTGPLAITPETYDCVGFAPEPNQWTTAYLTAEDSTGESLPSNVISFSLPIQSVPSAPKHFRRMP